MLGIDKFFFKAIDENAAIHDIVENRIFNPARNQAQEKEDKIPYIVLWFGGASSDYDTKDDGTLRPIERGTVNILVVAGDTKESDGTEISAVDNTTHLAELVHSAIEEAFEDDDFPEDDWNFEIDDCEPEVSEMEMDPMKPCCFLTLTYKCQTSKR